MLKYYVHTTESMVVWTISFAAEPNEDDVRAALIDAGLLGEWDDVVIDIGAQDELVISVNDEIRFTVVESEE